MTDVPVMPFSIVGVPKALLFSPALNTTIFVRESQVLSRTKVAV
jgi:hypothetical protein